MKTALFSEQLRQSHAPVNSCTHSTLGLPLARLFLVLLIAPKIFAISSITGKNSSHNFARLSAWWFDWVGLPHPKRKLIRSVLINGMCLFEVSVRKANAEISAELTSHTSPFGNDYNKLQSFAFWVFVFLFPTRQKLRFHLSYSHTSSLVFDVREPLCVQYERRRRVVGYCLAHKAWWHKKGTILFYASADFPSSSDV